MLRFLGCCVLALAALLPSAQAADFPTRPLTRIVAFPADGISDAGARLTAKLLGDRRGQLIQGAGVTPQCPRKSTLEPCRR